MMNVIETKIDLAPGSYAYMVNVRTNYGILYMLHT